MPNENALRQNRIKELLEQKGMDKFSPTDELLEKWHMSRKAWHAILRNEKDLLYAQVELIAAYFKCKITDLFPKMEEAK
jgi:hypothetical protein